MALDTVFRDRLASSLDSRETSSSCPNYLPASTNSLRPGHNVPRASPKGQALINAPSREVQSLRLSTSRDALDRGSAKTTRPTKMESTYPDPETSPTVFQMRKAANHQEMLTPPTTPKSVAPARFPGLLQLPTATGEQGCPNERFPDLSDLDFDVSGASLLGSGLWSKVYKLTPFLPSCGPGTTMSPPDSAICLSTPPATPQQSTQFPVLPRALAIKSASRPDSLEVFKSEAEVLRHLQVVPGASAHVVPFFGFSERHEALVFQCARRGTLEALLEQPCTPTESLQRFLHIAPQLIAGLDFVHRYGVVHADIKPANVLLDDLESSPSRRRDSNHADTLDNLLACYADFSSSFIATSTPPGSPTEAPGLGITIPPSTLLLPPPSYKAAGMAGGTWSYMAPELLSRDPALSAPSSASDVYGLGVTLMSLLLGGSPFREMESNVFMLREAVKCGDVEGFARRDVEFDARLDALEEQWRRIGGEGGLVERFLSPALVKNRDERVSASEWVGVTQVAVDSVS